MGKKYIYIYVAKNSLTRHLTFSHVTHDSVKNLHLGHKRNLHGELLQASVTSFIWPWIIAKTALIQEEPLRPYWFELKCAIKGTVHPKIKNACFLIPAVQFVQLDSLGVIWHCLPSAFSQQTLLWVVYHRAEGGVLRLTDVAIITMLHNLANVTAQLDSWHPVPSRAETHQWVNACFLLRGDMERK